jgi:hypothetical protein
MIPVPMFAITSHKIDPDGNLDEGAQLQLSFAQAEYGARISQSVAQFIQGYKRIH